MSAPISVHVSRPARRALIGAVAGLLAVPFAACSVSTGAADRPAAAGTSPNASSSSSTPQPAVAISSNVKDGAAAVKVNRLVRLTATDGTFSQVSVHSGTGERVAGDLNSEKTRWLATGRLEPGKKYVVQALASNSSGTMKTFKSSFATQNLSLDQQTYPSISPLGGQTVGVAMPVMIHFDRPVADRKRFEQNMSVTSTSGQKGSFYWIDANNVHYRPPHYWKSGSKVTVNVNVNSVSAGNGIYGQQDRKVTFDVGRRQVDTVDARSHLLKVYRERKLIRTIPITTGKPGYTTRSGTKVIIEKDRRHDMNSETIGLDPTGPDGYNLKGVEFAMRITFSGEFLHAAPWSVGSQGRANVSHGCTGMSTSNAGWLFENTMVGDPVEFSGTDVGMTLTNGYGDWNLSWDAWKKGSAL